MSSRERDRPVCPIPDAGLRAASSARALFVARRSLIRSAPAVPLIAGGAGFVGGAGLLSPALAQPKRPVDGTLRVGFVYVDPPGDFGWSHQHELGRRAMVKSLGKRVHTSVLEKIPEGQAADQAIRELANKGHRLIFGTWYGYMDSMVRIARSFPDFAFEHATGFKRAENLSTYNAKIWQARYLAGIIAGRLTRSGVLGYVAAAPYVEVVQGINAYALGARSVNPRATVHVRWVNQWNSPSRDREEAIKLIEANADLLTHHSETDAVLRTAEERKVGVIAFHTDGSKIAPTQHLASVTHHWGDYYTKRAEAVIAGEWKPEGYWGGLDDGAVRIEGMSGRRVPPSVQREVEAAQQAIVADRLQVFAGPLKDNRGKQRLGEGEPASDEMLGRMDWLVEGVHGEI